MYKITLSEQARKEYLYFSQSGNKAILNKIAALLNDIAEHPYTGLGKPEPLKYELAGKWFFAKLFTRYILLFPFLLGYVYTIQSVSQNNSYVYVDN